MRLKIVIVDLEISPRLKRWALGIGIPAIVILGGAAAAYATGLPVTWTNGQTLNASDLNASFAAVAPPGTIQAYGGTIDGNPGDTVDGGAPANLPPSGWLLCNGDQLNGLAYPALYAAIGTNFGGNTTSQAFDVPDLRGMFLRGVDKGAGHDPDAAGRTATAAGGNTAGLVGSYQADQYLFHAPAVTDTGHTHTDQGHTHPTQGYLINAGTAEPNFSGGDTGYQVSSGTGMGYAIIQTGYANIKVTGTGGNETRPKNVNVNYIIKY